MILPTGLNNASFSEITIDDVWTPAEKNKVILQLDELHKLQGLDSLNPMTVTPTSRTTGSISQTISGDGQTTTTVTRD